MNWLNVRLILGREIRDQLRDRRTLFMIAVLPLLLYPLLGMSFFQVTQFMREHANSVLVVGAPDSTDLPPLLDKNRFAPGLFDDAHTMNLLQATQQPAAPATNAALDPFAKIPEFKYCAVRVLPGGQPPVQGSFGGGQAQRKLVQAGVV